MLVFIELYSMNKELLNTTKYYEFDYLLCGGEAHLHKLSFGKDKTDILYHSKTK